MALVSLKSDEGQAPEMSASPYGYGTQLRLGESQCEALGITTPLRAGSVVKINAVAFVMSSTESAEDDSDSKGPDISMFLQITEMELSPGKKSTADMAKSLYKD